MLLIAIPFLYGGVRSLYQKSNTKPPPPALKNAVAPVTDTTVPDATPNESDVTSPLLDKSAIPPTQSRSDKEDPPTQIGSEATSPPSESDSDVSDSEQTDKDNDDSRK